MLAGRRRSGRGEASRLPTPHIKRQDYKKAADLYEEALKDDPTLNQAYFYLGNSYDNQFKPSRRGDPANDDLLEKAVQNYQLCSEKLQRLD